MITRLTCSIAALLLCCNLFASDGFLSGLKNDKAQKEKQLIIFFRPDCPYCQQMDKTIMSDQAFQSGITKNFTVKVYDISTPEGRLLADRFDVHAVPSMVNFNTADGSYFTTKGFGSINRMATALHIPGVKDAAPVKQHIDGVAACGDGIVDAGESCDDGNTVNGDGCNATCMVDPGYFCSGSPSVCSTVCGDGVVAGAESCDDGNTVNGDGCNASCVVDPGYSCTGSPSVCTNAAPANDNCSGAIALSGSSGTVTSNNNTATYSGVIGATGCAFNNSGVKDVWYQFTITGTKTITLNVNRVANIDPIVALYSGSCAGLTYINCDDDGGTPTPNSYLTATLNTGTYYIRVGGYYTPVAVASGTFQLVYNLNVSICGNGTLESGEECDDGNSTNGDGCSSTCKFENAASIIGASVNTDGTRPNPSAMLEVKSFDRGMLIPRMTTAQRTSIASPAKGLMVFDGTSNTFWFYNGSTWGEIGGVGGGLPVGTANQTLRSNGTNWLANSILQNDGTNVTVAGQLKITGGAPGANKVLTSDATGLATWQAPASGAAAFSVIADSSRTLFNGAASIRIHFGKIASGYGIFEVGTNFNSTTDEFVAPSAGVYAFTYNLSFTGLTGFYTGLSELRQTDNANVVKNQKAFFDYISVAAGLTQNVNHTVIMSLAAGDKVFVLAQKLNGTTTASATVDGNLGTNVTAFQGYKIN